MSLCVLACRDCLRFKTGRLGQQADFGFGECLLKKTIVTLIVLFSLIGSGQSGALGKSSDTKTLTEAQGLLDAGRFWGAALKLEKMLEADKDNADVYLTLGQCYLKMGKSDDALRAYSNYLQLKPNGADSEKYQTLVDELKQKSETSNATATGDYMTDTTQIGLYRWPDSRMPITVFIESGSAVNGYRPEFDEVLRYAFQEWMTATEEKIKFDFLTKRDGAELIVTWTDDMHAPELKAEAGKASVRQDSDGIKSGTILLLTVSPFQEGPLQCDVLHNICLHEIGHSLGLMGHSPNTDDIMYPLPTANRITPRDARTLHVVYAAAQEALAVASGGSSATTGGDSELSRLSPKTQADLFLKAGTKACFAGQYVESIAKLEMCLKIDPTVELARSNLSVAANNLAVQEQDETARMKLLHKALFWNPKMDAARKNLETLLDNLNISPGNAAERVKLADRLEKEDDLLGACAELSESLRLKQDPAVSQRESEMRAKVIAALQAKS